MCPNICTLLLKIICFCLFFFIGFSIRSWALIESDFFLLSDSLKFYYNLASKKVLVSHASDIKLFSFL